MTVLPRTHLTLRLPSAALLLAAALGVAAPSSTATAEQAGSTPPRDGAPSATAAGAARKAEGGRKTPLGISPGFMTLDLTQQALERDLDRMVKSGVTRLRIDLAWSTLQPGAGRYDWSTSDRVLDAARERDIKVLAIVGYEPGWAIRYAADGTRLPPDPGLFAEFVRTVSSRYAGRVDSWEIWNEPNLQRFWPSGPDPVSYAAMAEAASSALRQQDPAARVIVGAFAPADTTATQVSPMDFLRGIYAHLPQRAFDAVSVHPYSFPALPDETQPWNTFHRMRELHQIMVDGGDGDTPLWITEFGAPTGTSAVAVSEQEQAEMIRIGITEARKRSYIGPVYLYSQRDAGRDASDSEQNFGLLDHGGSAKPAWKVVVNKA